MCVWWSSGYGAVDASQSLDKDKALRKNRLYAFHDLVAQEKERIGRKSAKWKFGKIPSRRGAWRLFCLLLRERKLATRGGTRSEPVCGALFWESRPGP